MGHPLRARQDENRGLELPRRSREGASGDDHRFTLEVEAVRPRPRSTAPAASPASIDIDVQQHHRADKAQRGRLVQAAIVIDIPAGYHINSNRPTEKYLIPTQLKVDAPGEVRIGPVGYPRALLKSFKFSKKQLSVYEGRAFLRFNVSVPANYSGGSVDLKAQVRLQSCNDEVCFPPRNYDANMRIDVVGASDRVTRVNGQIFGGRRR